MGKIVVDRGLEQYTIEDKNGTVLGKFEMNPADVELVKRYEHVAEAVSHIADNVDERKDIVDIVKEWKKSWISRLTICSILTYRRVSSPSHPHLLFWPTVSFSWRTCSMLSAS